MSRPLPGYLLPVTIPLSWLYGQAVAHRNRRYDAGADVHSVDVPVISIGNITTGGTGKTPMVRWVADLLIGMGRHPIVAMRGYGAANGEPSDEQAEYAATMPDLPVLAHPNRVASLRAYLPAHPEIDCVILDDGFQHRRLARDLDLVLVDATRSLPADRLLPAGLLREPPGNLKRADAVIITRAESVEPTFAATMQRLHGRQPIAWTRHIWRNLQVHAADEVKDAPVDWLDGKRVLTVLGVGNPRAVEEQVEAAGAKLVARFPAGDHERYDRAAVTTMRTMCDGLDALVTTPKDWVKLRHLIDLHQWSTPIAVPRVSIEVFEGREPLEQLIADVVARRR